MNGILISLIVLAMIYYVHVNSVICDGESDCSIYNNQDEKSSCDPICSKQGKVFKDYIKGQCECENSVKLKTTNEHVDQIAFSKATPFVANLSDIGIELYTNVNEKKILPTTILPSNTPNDTLFNNRDILQKHENNRSSSLIFG
jgi:hypothetical protein